MISAPMMASNRSILARTKAILNVSSPNETYWSRVDTIVNAAAAHGISILFDTWETGALMPLARANGDSKMRSFGAFLGNRYKNVPNILWITGNDFQTWTDPGDNDLMQNLMAGIASADATHLQTTELNYLASGSLDDLLLVPYTKLAGAYDYYCSYGQTLAQYNNPAPMPVFFEEGFYEYRGGLEIYVRKHGGPRSLALRLANSMGAKTSIRLHQTGKFSQHHWHRGIRILEYTTESYEVV